MNFFHAHLSSLTIALILCHFALSCNKESDSPDLSKQPQGQNISNSDKSAELDKLVRDQKAALIKLNTDKANLDAQAVTLENKIVELNKQLTAAGGKTSGERAELQKTLDNVLAEKDALTKQIAELKTKNDLLQTQIDETKARSNQLQIEIAAAQGKSPPNSSVSGGPSSPFTSGTPASPAVTGPFNSIRLVDPSKDLCLDLPTSNIGDEAPLKFSLCSSFSQGQHFKISDSNALKFNIKPRISSRCVAVPSLTSVKTVIQTNCSDLNSQLWEFYAVSGDEFKLRNSYSGNCMSIQADGSIVQNSCDLNASRFTWFDVE